MQKTTTMNWKKVAEINGYGIIRSENKKVDFFGAPYGQRIVWYDVCLDNGEGDIVESFKTLSAARKYAENN